MFNIVAIALGATLASVSAAAAQPAEIYFEDGMAILEGELDDSIAPLIERVVTSDARARRMVFEYVPGSDGDANLLAGRTLKKAGVTTIMEAGGMIASGGTDLFLGGLERIVEEGACIGVHSWADDDERRLPKDIPRDDREHKIYLDYYRDVGIPETFYWFTLNAAPAEGMHWMSRDEIMRFGVATRFIPRSEHGKPDAGPCDQR